MDESENFLAKERRIQQNLPKIAQILLI